MVPPRLLLLGMGVKGAMGGGTLEATFRGDCPLYRPVAL